MNTIATATEGLTIVTLVMAIISMVLSCMALWPQWKDRLVVVRDSVLWIALVVILVAAVTAGWRHYANLRTPSHSVSHDGTVDQLTADYRR